MKQLSIGATRNRRKAQFMLVITNILLVILPVLLGFILNDLGIKLPRWSMYVFLIILAGSFIFYPIRFVKKEISNNTYKKRKTFELIFLISSFFVTTIAVNGNYNNNLHFKTLNAEIVHNVEHTSFVDYQDEHTQFSDISPVKKASKFWKKVLGVLLILLVLAILLGLIYLSLAFGGAINLLGGSAAAILLTIFGFSSVFIAGAVFLIKHIIDKNFSTEKDSNIEQDDTPSASQDKSWIGQRKDLGRFLIILLGALALVIVGIGTYTFYLGVSLFGVLAMLVLSTSALLIIFSFIDYIAKELKNN